MELKASIIKESAPHIRRKDNLVGMMLDVIIALCPVIIFSYIAFRLYAVRNLFIPVAVMVLAEYIYCFIRFKPKEGKKSFKLLFRPKEFGYKLYNLLSAIISGLVYGLMFPAQEGAMYFYILPIGALFGMIVAKLLFGGFGNNIFNPAAVGMVFAKACFGSHYVYFQPFTQEGGQIVSAGATSLGSDYIITARAKGASKTRILFGHVLKNSLAPTISYSGPMFAGIITGSLVVEQIYSVPGIGASFVKSITNRDYSLIMGTTVVMAGLVVIMTLISDLLYKVVNPRVELE